MIKTTTTFVLECDICGERETTTMEMPINSTQDILIEYYRNEKRYLTGWHISKDGKLLHSFEEDK